MFPIFETPIFVTLMIVFCLLFFFVLFLAKLPRENGKQQRNSKTSDEIARVTQEDHLECTMLGFLQELPKGDPIPDECMSCQKLLECLLKKTPLIGTVGKIHLGKVTLDCTVNFFSLTLSVFKTSRSTFRFTLTGATTL